MRSNRTPLIALVALLAGFYPVARLAAQESTPEASPTVPPSAKRAKVSFVRLWYVGEPKSPRITAGFKSGAQEPRVIGSHVRPGRLGSYRMFLPGDYSCVVMDGNVIPDAAGKLPPKTSPVTAPVPVTLKPGAYHTLVVEEKNGRIASTFLDDVPPKPETDSRLRIFDYTNSKDDSLRMIFNEQESEVWNPSQGTPFEKSLAGIEGLASLKLFSKINDKPFVICAFETSIETQKSYSLVIFFDRYGQKAFTFVEDASAPFDTDEMEALLKGS